MIKIIVIDTNEADLNRIHALLSSEQDFEVIGLGRDSYEGLRIVDSLKPDVVILDLSPEYIDGAEFGSLLRSKSPSTAIILFTASENERLIRNAIGNGLSGYLLKSTDFPRLAGTVRCVFNGGHWISPRITAKALGILSVLIQNSGKAPVHVSRGEVPSFTAEMSRMEIEIINCLAQGRSNKEIAESLRLKAGTVRNYVSSAMRKVGLHNRTEVAIFALRNGLVASKEALIKSN
jgi:DNA-binding NarL/FixJ family response regulator